MSGSSAPIPDLVSPVAAPYRLDGTSGEAVVLVHGFTGAPSHFRPLAERLNAEGFTVNVPLLDGHGSTIEHLASTTATDWERTVRWAVQAVADHRRVHMVGLSMGGLLGIAAAAGEGAATVATINSPVLVRDRRLYVAGIAHRWVPLVDWDDTGEVEPDDELAHLRIPNSGFRTASAHELVKVILRGYRIARRLRRPSLVIQSKVDRVVDPLSGRILAGALGRDARLVWLERSAHNALLDRERQTVHDLVLEHLTNA